jgi:AcrR family transcriptional regulator
MSEATGTRERSGRPSAARERILATADRLFYNEGIHAVGVQRVVAESAVTRVTLYRHFPSKDDLVSAYLARRSDYDHDQVDGIIAAHPDDPRAALDELATALTRDDFGAVKRGCPFINASAEFTGSHPARVHAREIRSWVTGRIEELLRQLGHRSPRSTAEQLMMVRTGAVVSCALDGNELLNEDFLACWTGLIEAGLPPV